MSAIFGCVSLDGRPLPHGTGETMAKALAHWGPDGVTCGSRTGAVLGMAALAIAPESIRESSPAWDEARGCLFTAAARLDNRGELCESLGIAQAEGAALADGTLVRLACRHWGEEAPGRILGDWSFAEWDEAKRTLRLSRDQLGITGLFYHYRHPLFAFASDPQGLLALEWVERRINERKLASYLAFVHLAGDEETSWENIFKLMPGCSLQAGPEAMRIRRYWDLSRAPALPGRRDEDYLAGFLERFRAAVKVRLRSRSAIGVSLSAGLDSSAVTALAAQALKQEGRSLAAFTAVPQFSAAHLVPGELADEWRLAHAVAGRFANIGHRAVDAAAVTPLAGLSRAIAIHHAPLHAAVNEFWLIALHEAARELGIGVMLNGQFGNNSVSWRGDRAFILNLFLQGEWDKGRQAMTRWEQRNRRSWIGALAECIAKPMLLPFWHRARRRIALLGKPVSEIAPIHPDFASRMGIGRALRPGGATGCSDRVLDPARERLLALQGCAATAGPVMQTLGAAFRMEVRDPTADLRLVEYCLGVPGEQDVKDGGQRMLIRRAMEGILPPEVQWNTMRGRQGADAALRLLAQPRETDAALDRLQGNEAAASYLGLPLMRRTWSELQERPTPSACRRAQTVLLRGIMCGFFLEDAGCRTTR